MRILSLCLMGVCLSGAASASVITYNTFGQLQGAASLTFFDDFQSYQTGKSGTTLGTQGITFTQLETGTLDVSLASLIENTTRCVTTCLTADGNEDFRIQLTSGNTFTAIGFDFLTNAFDAPQVTITGTSGTLGTFFLTQGPNTLGFVGIVSDQPIVSVRIASARGNEQDSAMDNVYIGTANSSAVPEPGSVLLGSGALIGLFAASRLRRSLC